MTKLKFIVVVSKVKNCHAEFISASIFMLILRFWILKQVQNNPFEKASIEKRSTGWICTD